MQAGQMIGDQKVVGILVQALVKVGEEPVNRNLLGFLRHEHCPARTTIQSCCCKHDEENYQRPHNHLPDALSRGDLQVRPAKPELIPHLHHFAVAEVDFDEL